MDPLDGKLWGLRMVRSDQRPHGPGRRPKGVTVGILDSGIDARNPDLAPNFDVGQSRNFVTDIPAIDGPCEFAELQGPGRLGRLRPRHARVRHRRRRANGIGVSGVAPNVTLVEIRGGQDSGFLFLEPVVDALTYGADIGLDVINMSFYIDPWLYNCTANPADSPEEQARAADDHRHREPGPELRARARASRWSASLGNNHEDLGKPRTDITSPDYPPGTAYPRPIDNATASTCRSRVRT